MIVLQIFAPRTTDPKTGQNIADLAQHEFTILRHVAALGLMAGKAGLDRSKTYS